MAYTNELDPLTMSATLYAKTWEDLEIALDEIKRRVSDGFTSGSDCNESSSYSFDISTQSPDN